MENDKLLFEKIKENVNFHKTLTINGRVYKALIDLNKEEYIIWKRNNGESENEVYCSQGGERAHYNNRNITKSGTTIGIYTPRKGYYYITEIPPTPILANTGRSTVTNYKSKSSNVVNTTNGDSRIIEKPIYAKYDSNEPFNFIDEVVLIETKFLYNHRSNGTKELELEEGMIIHVYKDTDLVNDTYSIHWRVLDSKTGAQIQETYDNSENESYKQYRGSYVQDIEGWSDDDINDVFDGNPDAYWNID